MGPQLYISTIGEEGKKNENVGPNQKGQGSVYYRRKKGANKELETTAVTNSDTRVG